MSINLMCQDMNFSAGIRTCLLILDWLCETAYFCHIHVNSFDSEFIFLLKTKQKLKH